jgi:SAM-dependent methyltransferase
LPVTIGSLLASLAKRKLDNQAEHWSRQAARYDELFLDPYGPDVVNPLWQAIEAIPAASRKAAADLGCGTGTLLPYLAQRFESVIALDFAPSMLTFARKRLDGAAAARVTFLERAMHELDDLAGRLDVAVAVNSLVMPDVRLIDQTLSAIRKSLKPDGLIMGVVPSIDAIYYHMMLLIDHSLDQGFPLAEAEKLAALHVERRHYDFAFGRFQYEGLRQKFWLPFEVEYRLKKAGFESPILKKVLYPWDDSLAGGRGLAGSPPSWDWFFQARA